MRWFILYSLLVLLLSPSDAALAQSPCDLGDKLRAAGVYDQAQASYIAALKADSQLACARAGIEEIAAARGRAARHYEQGRALEAARDIEGAITAYLHAVTEVPRHAEVHAAIARLLSEAEPGDPYAAVRALEAQGLYTAATEQLKEVLKENPGAKVPADLDHLTEDGIILHHDAQLFARRWLEPLRALALSALSWLVTLAALLVIIMALLFRRVPWLKRRLRRRIDIRAFAKGPKDLEVGPAVAVLIEERLFPQPKHRRLDLVEGDLGYFSMPDSVRKALPSGWLLDILAWAVPRNVFVVYGNILIEGSQGRGVSVSLVEESNARIVAIISLWDYDLHPSVVRLPAGSDAEPYYRLAQRAADWLEFEITRL